MQAGQSPKMVSLHGNLSVDRAAALKSEIAVALETSDIVLLGISRVEDLDLACLQVLYSAKASASARGKELHFHGSLPPQVSKRLVTCGFLRDLPGSAEEFELGLVGF